MYSCIGVMLIMKLRTTASEVIERSVTMSGFLKLKAYFREISSMTKISATVQSRSRRGIALNICRVVMKPNIGRYIKPYRDSTKKIKLKENTTIRKRKSAPRMAAKE